MLKPQEPINREGYPFIFLFALATLIAAIFRCPWTTGILLVITTFTLAFFRDPERFIPPTPSGIISPADGKIIVIENVASNPFTQEAALKISIFMNIFNVHVNRIPFNGTVTDIQYRPGKFYSADSAKGAQHNEYCAVITTTPNGQKMAFVQIAGLIARRIVCWLERGDQVCVGKRFGLIRFGSRVDLYLPPSTEPCILLGQKVRAGETIIGHLQHPTV
jgi:phosphatidylserine decarboxylase